ncbi:uracil-DNA glycosylase [Candidatus Thorarchaeota archaeon]|nr:MAG: uracil-DNA glycosylase [Candidatus Thorarchaeota archaeon]
MSTAEKLELLYKEIRNCKKCPLHKSRKNAVPGEGPIDAEVMFVGEAPGAREDETGRPFVGRSGQLLTEMLEEAGIPRDEVYITSVLKSHPPNNRQPRKNEINACLPYLHRQIELIDPQFIALLGGVAVSSVIGNRRLLDYHGTFHKTDDRTFFITYHPAAALRFPEYKQRLREDLMNLKHRLGGD